VAAATENWFIGVLFPTKGRKTAGAAHRTRRALAQDAMKANKCAVSVFDQVT
jgi:hypothetical protein